MTTKAKYRKVTCQSCDVLVINNVICHERGCLDAWQDSKVSCRECGFQFAPVERGQRFCSEDCAQAYYN